MANKILETRMKSKGDSYKNFTTENPLLLENEVVVVNVAADDTDAAVIKKPGTYLKVGNGTDNFRDLPFIMAMAGDVYDWAKASAKPTYSASEITGLADYISGEVEDTNTTYQLIMDPESGQSGADLMLQKKEVGETAWTTVNTITLPKHTFAEGSINGTISVDTTNVKVHGLGSAAYENTSAFDAAGAADTARFRVIGTDTDAPSQDTIKGTKKYVDEEVKKVNDAISAIDIPEYSIVKATTATTGMASTYELQKDGVAVGAKIDIPKDYLVKSVSVKTATTDDPSGFDADVKYIDFVVNSVEGTGNESHLYLKVEDLVKPYTVGDGLIISGNNVITLSLDESTGISNANGKVHLKTATATTPGSMSANDKKKLDGLARIAETGNVNDLVQTSGDILILDCGNATV